MFARQLSDRSPARQLLRYNYALGHLGHEVGHRWSAYVTAKVSGKLVSLIEWPHWVPGLQSPVAFPYSLPVEASTLGGSVWQDNTAGTYTQLRDGFFVPATGYSYLDLYLMGLLSAPEVPDVGHSQRQFNTGIVVMVEQGKTPSPELIARGNGIREQWMEYWKTVTGHRASMTVTPR